MREAIRLVAVLEMAALTFLCVYAVTFAVLWLLPERFRNRLEERIWR